MDAFKKGKEDTKIGKNLKLNKIPYSLIFVRHGESEFKPEMVKLGTFDLSLTEEGRNQCKKTVEEIKFFVKSLRLEERVGQNFEKTVIFSSPLKRTKETAEIIKEMLKIKRDIIFIDELKEFYFGEYQDGKLVGMESRDGFRKRTADVLLQIGEILEKEKEKEEVFPIFVAHGKVWKYQWNTDRKLDFAEACFLDKKIQKVIYQRVEKENYDYQHSYAYKTE